MIIKRYRLRSAWSLTRFSRHIFEGAENEAIRVLQGSRRDLADFQQAARRSGATYAVRHFIIAPEVETSDDDLMRIVQMLAAEFGFDPAVLVAVLHRKPRRTGTGIQHLHLLVPEVDLVSGGVLSSSQDYPRQERIAREAEFLLGQPFQRGRHLAAVLKWISESSPAVHAALRAAFPDHEPALREGFSSKNAARVLRETAIDLADLKGYLRTVWARSRSPALIRKAIAQHGLEISMGEKAGVLIVKHGNSLVGPLHRLLGSKLADVRKDFQIEQTAGAPETRGTSQSRPSDPSRHDGDTPKPSAAADIAPRPSRRRRRRDDRESRTNDPTDTGIRPRSHPGDPGELGGLASPSRPSFTIAVAPPLLFAVIGEEQALLTEQRDIADGLALSNLARFDSWFDAKTTSIEDDRKRLTISLTELLPEKARLSAELEKADRDLRERPREHTASTAHSNEYRSRQRPERRGWLRLLFGRRREDIQASALRNGEAVSGRNVEAARQRRNEVAATLRILDQKRQNRDYHLSLTSHDKNVALERRRIALESLRRELKDDPTFVFTGQESYEKRLNLIEEKLNLESKLDQNATNKSEASWKSY